jgi:uncharacterized protein (TIGR03067 family)
MPLTRLTLVALTTFFALATARTAPAQGPADAIKGIWSVDSLTFNGVKIPDDPTAGAQLTAYDGSQYVQRKGLTIVEEGSYEVDASKTPGAIDLIIKKGPDAGKRQLGIYQVDGDTLRVCLAEPGSKKRPRSFDASAGHLLVVNTRFRP